MMGVELVEAVTGVRQRSDCVCAFTHGDRPVDVIYRRVDDDFLDPVHFRGDSVLGCAGLVSATRGPGDRGQCPGQMGWPMTS